MVVRPTDARSVVPLMTSAGRERFGCDVTSMWLGERRPGREYRSSTMRLLEDRRGCLVQSL